jgi:hypothetical protein
VDEAFLRRIQYKVSVDDPTPENWEEIYRRECERRRIPFLAHSIEHIYEAYYGRRGILPRACHPRDILNHVASICRYEGIPPQIDDDLLDRACHGYFLVMARVEMEAFQGKSG